MWSLSSCLCKITAKTRAYLDIAAAVSLTLSLLGQHIYVKIKEGNKCRGGRGGAIYEQVPQSVFMFHSTLNSPARIFVLCHGVIFQLKGGGGDGREVSISILLRMDQEICTWLLSFAQQFTGTGWHPNQPHI